MREATQRFPHDFLGKQTITADDAGVSVHYKNLVGECSERFPYAELDPKPLAYRSAEAGWRRLGRYALLVSLFLAIFPGFRTIWSTGLVISVLITALACFGLGFLKKDWVSFYDGKGNLIVYLELPEHSELADYISSRIAEAHSSSRATFKGG